MQAPVFTSILAGGMPGAGEKLFSMDFPHDHFLTPFLSLRKESTSPIWISKISTLDFPRGPEEMVRFPGGDQITFAPPLHDMGRTKVIFVGESRGQIGHHQIQPRRIHTLGAKGKDAVIGTETFERGSIILDSSSPI
jgi:hypothetical protein